MQRLSLALLFAFLSLSALTAQQPSSPPAVAQTPAATGAADRGKPLYLAYGCYACHGYNGQTGNGPRLQPPRMTAPQFTLYIRAPRTRQMPAYTTKVLSDTEATDIFAYVVSLPREPELKDVPLLNALAAQHEPDPFNGTWVLNVAKSKMQPATASKSEIIHYRITGNEEDFLSDAVTIEGYPESIKYTARYDDGKPYPFSITINGKVTNPGAQTMVKKIDTWTRERYNVRDGKPVIASRRVVSKDGKTMTITIVRVDPQGRETINEVRLLEKM